jgi:hypothetical protein
MSKEPTCEKHYFALQESCFLRNLAEAARIDSEKDQLIYFFYVISLHF